MKEIKDLEEMQNNLKDDQSALNLTILQYEENKTNLETSIQKIKNYIQQAQTNIQTLKKKLKLKKQTMNSQILKTKLENKKPYTMKEKNRKKVF